MRSSLVGAFALAGIAVIAQARPVVVEPSATFGTPDNTYTSFGDAVGIDGDYAIVTASRRGTAVLGEPDRTFRTAFVFRRSGAGWTVVRRLDEHVEDPDFPIPAAVAMKDGIAAVQIVQTDFWQLTSGGWVKQPANIHNDGPGPYLTIDRGQVLSGDGTGPWNGLIFAKDATGTWTNLVTLEGKLRFSGSDDEFRGGPVDIDGPWALVHQASSDDGSPVETFVFHDYGGTSPNGWSPVPYGALRAPADATQFGDAVAVRWPDLFVAGGNESGTYVFREVPAMGFHVATQIQTADDFMGAGHAGAFAHTDEFLLAHAWSYDRNASVINVFTRNSDGTYEHVATLAGKNGETLGRAIAICGRSVLVGGGGNGLVHDFELPASLASPDVIQDGFNDGNAAGWTASAGSLFSIRTAGHSRVLRQSATDRATRAVLANADWTTEAIEADMRPTQFGAANAGIGLATRFQNPQNFYEAVLRANGRVELRRVASGTSRLLASATIAVTPNRNYRVRLESAGTLHRVLVDGELVLDVDSPGPTHGHVALVTDRAAADFDNVVVSPALVATTYATDFERTDAGPWKTTGPGLWMLWPGLSTVYFQSSVAGDARASIGAPVADQSVRVRARLNTFATPSGSQERWFGVMTRYSDDQNYYYLTLRSSNTLDLRKQVNGAVTTLASLPFTVSPMTWYDLRLDAVGDQLRAYVNGELMLEATDGSLKSGAAGPVMFKAATDYDDYIAYRP